MLGTLACGELPTQVSGSVSSQMWASNGTVDATISSTAWRSARWSVDCRHAACTRDARDTPPT